MSSTAPPVPAPGPAPGTVVAPAPRRAWRGLRDPVLGGVAAGLAAHLAVPVMWVRAGFVVATFMGGSGVAAYAALWAMLPAGPPPEVLAPGLASASRDGRRPRRGRRLSDIGPVLTLAVLGIGIVFATEAVLGNGWWVWPLAIGIVGVALLWRQADEAQRERWLDATGQVDPIGVVVGRGGWAAWARIAAGVGLMIVAFVLFVLRDGSLSLARDAVIVVLLALVGIAIVAGPLVYRLVGELGAEREERVRTQERADVAAHLHDSVLQTLALIQKNPADASRLARAQERDLRAWLYAGESLDEATVASALRAVAADVEDAYGIQVDVVAVGDVAFDETVRPIVQAAREAATNAAKHAGVPRVDVYAEITPIGIDVFVRDRGVGFDPAVTPEDRMGVRGSILDRMQRHGGTAEVRSTPGEGTEVRLHLDHTPTDQQEETT
ncbi:PspC domain-containing protein [Nocardioides caeni]|uniref:PspC domain-containing protein n=1 Tax=Nocardioides caeni TaxID=574700 RepID=A0A4S8N756_9ACTN|nr:ATP-binding protein [Nocardioides caeni]THV10749.1 PspC domain-containing protein [Nocardioides caeni]